MKYIIPERKLDNILIYLDNKEEYQETFNEIKTKSKSNLSNKELHLILEKLLKDQYIGFSFINKNGIPTSEKTYYISFEGQIFLNRGGYTEESRMIKKNKCWIKTKTTAVFLNAIIIILIGLAGVWATYDSKNKDKKISNLELKIDSLQTEINLKNIRQDK